MTSNVIDQIKSQAEKRGLTCDVNPLYGSRGFMNISDNGSPVVGMTYVHGMGKIEVKVFEGKRVNVAHTTVCDMPCSYRFIIHNGSSKKLFKFLNIMSDIINREEEVV